MNLNYYYTYYNYNTSIYMVLDLIFCRSHDSCNCLINGTKSYFLTDYFIITFRVIFPMRPSLSKKLINYRKI